MSKVRIQARGAESPAEMRRIVSRNPHSRNQFPRYATDPNSPEADLQLGASFLDDYYCEILEREECHLPLYVKPAFYGYTESYFNDEWLGYSHYVKANVGGAFEAVLPYDLSGAVRLYRLVFMSHHIMRGIESEVTALNEITLEVADTDGQWRTGAGLLEGYEVGIQHPYLDEGLGEVMGLQAGSTDFVRFMGSFAGPALDQLEAHREAIAALSTVS